MTLAKKVAGKLRAQESTAVAAGAMHNDHGITDMARRVARGRAQRGVVQAQFGHLFTRFELKIVGDPVAFVIGELRRVLGLGPARAGEQ